MNEEEILERLEHRLNRETTVWLRNFRDEICPKHTRGNEVLKVIRTHLPVGYCFTQTGKISDTEDFNELKIALRNRGIQCVYWVWSTTGNEYSIRTRTESEMMIVRMLSKNVKCVASSQNMTIPSAKE